MCQHFACADNSARTCIENCSYLCMLSLICIRNGGFTHISTPTTRRRFQLRDRCDRLSEARCSLRGGEWIDRHERGLGPLSNVRPHPHLRASHRNQGPFVVRCAEGGMAAYFEARIRGNNRCCPHTSARRSPVQAGRSSTAGRTNLSVHPDDRMNTPAQARLPESISGVLRTLRKRTAPDPLPHPSLRHGRPTRKLRHDSCDHPRSRHRRSALLVHHG